MSSPESSSSQRRANRARVVRALRERGAQSRRALAEIGLSRSTVTSVVEELIDAGTVTEVVGRRDTRGTGRPPTLVGLRGTLGVAVGVEVANGVIRASVCNTAQELLLHDSVPMDDHTPPEATLKTVAALVGHMLDRLGLARADVLGVGLAMPGPIQRRSGLNGRATCVIFTSHRWREIEDLADRVTVFRNGTWVATRDRLSEAEAVTLMSGRNFAGAYPDVTAIARGDSALRVDDLAGGLLRGVSFDLRRGEILGVGGLAGQGQRDLFLTLFGARRAAAGAVSVGGEAVTIRRPKDAIRAGLGIAYVPEDRKAEGLFLPLSIRDNIALATLSRRSSYGFVARGAERAAVSSIAAQLRIGGGRATSQAVGTLSGGNQQKVVMARWLLTEADVLLLYDVTRGVDAATKHDIYELVADLAGRGKAILFHSSETEEIANLCHRVLVLREGRIAAELPGPVGDAERIVAASIKEAPDA